MDKGDDTKDNVECDTSDFEEICPFPIMSSGKTGVGKFVSCAHTGAAQYTATRWVFNNSDCFPLFDQKGLQLNSGGAALIAKDCVIASQLFGC